MHRLIKIFCVICSLISILIFTLILTVYFRIPDKITVVDDNPYIENDFLGLEIISFDSKKEVTKIQNNENLFNETQVKLLNIIPVKKTVINNTKRQYVVVGGECFGIKIYTDGVVVVDMDNVQTEDGIKNPAKEAGIKIGDIIKTVDGVSVKSNAHLANLLQKSKGNEIEIAVERQGKEQKIKFRTFKEKSTEKYRAGIWVRDSTAGLGTISFYNPINNSFAGLGHGVYDIDTGEILPLGKGEVCSVTINDIYKSKKGNVGELCGILDSRVNGTMCINSEIGVYGFLSIPNKESMPVAIKSEIKTGKAQIACSVNNMVEYYDIEITKIYSKSSSVNKDMVIRITDEKLIDITGGIVQGMSGSPIIQNGMIVGALTHVFVNNPKQGYAILAEKMVEASTCQEMEKQEQIQNAS